jgi:hypothetical protein
MMHIHHTFDHFWHYGLYHFVSMYFILPDLFLALWLFNGFNIVNYFLPSSVRLSAKPLLFWSFQIHLCLLFLQFLVELAQISRNLAIIGFLNESWDIFWQFLRSFKRLEFKFSLEAHIQFQTKASWYDDKEGITCPNLKTNTMLQSPHFHWSLCKWTTHYVKEGNNIMQSGKNLTWMYHLNRVRRDEISFMVLQNLSRIDHFKQT